MLSLCYLGFPWGVLPKGLVKSPCTPATAVQAFGLQWFRGGRSPATILFLLPPKREGEKEKRQYVFLFLAEEFLKVAEAWPD